MIPVGAGTRSTTMRLKMGRFHTRKAGRLTADQRSGSGATVTQDSLRNNSTLTPANRRRAAGSRRADARLLPTWPRRLRRRINAPPILRNMIGKLLLDVLYELHGRQMRQPKRTEHHAPMVHRRTARAIIQSNFVAGLHILHRNNFELSLIPEPPLARRPRRVIG